MMKQIFSLIVLLFASNVYSQTDTVFVSKETMKKFQGEAKFAESWLNKQNINQYLNKRLSNSIDTLLLQNFRLEHPDFTVTLEYVFNDSSNFSYDLQTLLDNKFDTSRAFWVGNLIASNSVIEFGRGGYIVGPLYSETPQNRVSIKRNSGSRYEMFLKKHKEEDLTFIHFVGMPVTDYVYIYLKQRQQLFECRFSDLAITRVYMIDATTD